MQGLCYQWHCNSYSSIDPFHARRSIAVTVVMYHMTYERYAVEVKQLENRELDSSEMYRCQKNDLAAK